MPAVTKPKPAAKPKPKTEPTKYMVLVEEPDGKLTKLETIPAANDLAAVKAVHGRLRADHKGEQPLPDTIGLVGIPERSFRVRKLTTTTVQHVKVA